MTRFFVGIIFIMLLSRCKHEQSFFNEIEQPFVTIFPDSINESYTEVKFKFIVSSSCYSRIATPLFRDESGLKDIKILLSDNPPLIDCNQLPFQTNISKNFVLMDSTLTVNFLDKGNTVTVSRSMVVTDHIQSTDYLWKIDFDTQFGSPGDTIAIAYRDNLKVSKSKLKDTIYARYEAPFVIGFNKAAYDLLYYNVFYSDSVGCPTCLNRELFTSATNPVYIEKDIPEVITVYLNNE